VFKVYSTADGSTSVRYTITGALNIEEPFKAPITDISVLAKAPTLLRLDRVFFAFEKGLRASLHWEDDSETLILPLEDRGFFSFEDYFGGWSNPVNPGCTGNILLQVLGANAERTWLFALKIELAKQNR